MKILPSLYKRAFSNEGEKGQSNKILREINNEKMRYHFPSHHKKKITSKIDNTKWKIYILIYC